MQIKNHEEVRERLKEYYRQADLWVPKKRDDVVDSHRIYRFQVLRDDGSTHFYRLRDRITSTEKLRDHLIKETPINAYFSVSSFLNPSITGEKTYKDENGNVDIENAEVSRNNFLWSDFVIDCDHRDTEQVEKIYNFLKNRHIPEEHMYLVFSGGGFHIKVKQWFRDKTIENPIKREQAAYNAMHQLAYLLADKGFEFDFHVMSGSINSPSTDTRRVTKLPNTVTKYGNKAEIVDINKIHSFEPEQIIDDVLIRSASQNYSSPEARAKRTIYIE